MKSIRLPVPILAPVFTGPAQARSDHGEPNFLTGLLHASGLASAMARYSTRRRIAVAAHGGAPAAASVQRSA